MVTYGRLRFTREVRDPNPKDLAGGWAKAHTPLSPPDSAPCPAQGLLPGSERGFLHTEVRDHEQEGKRAQRANALHDDGDADDCPAHREST